MMRVPSADSPQRVEDGSAGGATAKDGFVADRWEIGAFLQRGEHAGKRDHLAREQENTAQQHSDAQGRGTHQVTV